MQSLPFEILQEIGIRVERLNDKKSLRETCTRFGDVFKAQVLEEVTLNIHKNNLQPGINLLHALADPAKDYPRYIRTLNILSLSPRYFPDPNPESDWRVCATTLQLDTNLIGEWLCGSESEEGHGSCAEVDCLLRPALESLQYLRAVRWRWNPKDGPMTQDIIAKSLSTLEHIKEFRFCYAHLDRYAREQPPLPDLHNLEVLSISISMGAQTTWTRSEGIMDPLLHHLLSQTKSLSALDLGTGLRPGLPAVLDACDPSNISHLGLNGFSCSSTRVESERSFSKCLRLFTHLTSLDLRGVDFGHQFVFEILYSNQIRLRRIVIDCVTDMFLDYIASYSGLEYLSIKFQPIGYSEIVTGVLQAERFFRVLLPLHRGTLVDLEIEPAYESEWCFSESNVDALSCCRQLRNLSIKVKPQGMQVDSTVRQLLPFSRPSELNPVHLLLNMISSSLQHLQSLFIDSAQKPNVERHRQLGRIRNPCHPFYCICQEKPGLFSKVSPGVKHCFDVRGLIRASIKHQRSGETQLYDPAVLKWVKLYVGRERFIIEGL
ncbi:hypothetical protein VKT23_006107 [Stygiomarasmius scandens]|uniref:F-box domain-containing protein n=1 Tax=Marasmiellus scandens TaxID=2682957 RepID=A0ABR1JTR0_9AGAR